MNNHQIAKKQAIKELESIRGIKSSSGYGGIKPEGLKPPGQKRWVSRYRPAPPAKEGIWSRASPR